MSDVMQSFVVISDSDSNDGSGSEESTFQRWRYSSPLSSPEYSPTQFAACYGGMSAYNCYTQMHKPKNALIYTILLIAGKCVMRLLVYLFTYLYAYFAHIRNT